MKIGAVLLLFTILLLGSCAPSRLVEPLQRNENSVTVSMGGPVFKNLGAPIPMPLSSISYGRGLTKKISSIASIHITSAIYQNLHFELGGLVGIRSYQKYTNKYLPGVSATVLLNSASSLRGGISKVWPQIDVNAYWKVWAREDLFYVGISNWFELQNLRAHGEPQPNPWLLSPQIGYNYGFGRYSANLEVKFIAPNIRNDQLAIEYFSATGKTGALGVYLGVSRKF